MKMLPPKFPFLLIAEFGHQQIGKLRTLAYLRIKSYYRYGILPLQEDIMAKDLGLSIKTFRKHLTWLEAKGFLAPVKGGILRLVSLSTLNLPTKWGVVLTEEEILDKNIFSAKLVAAWIDYKARVQAYLDKKKLNQTPQKMKEARCVRPERPKFKGYHAKRQVIQTAKLPFSYITRTLSMSRSTFSKIRGFAELLKLLTYKAKYQVFDRNRHQLFGQSYCDLPYFCSKKMGLTLRHSTEYRVDKRVLQQQVKFYSGA